MLLTRASAGLLRQPLVRPRATVAPHSAWKQLANVHWGSVSPFSSISNPQGPPAQEAGPVTPPPAASSTSSSSSSSPPLSSVSPEEIAKFSRLSSEWWAPEGHFQMLHQMNSARVDYIRQYAPAHLQTATAAASSSPQRATFSPHPESLVRPFRGLHMLDVGCGGGLLCEALARLGGQVTGIDATYDNIQIARVHAQKDPQLANSEASLDYFHTTAEDIQQTGQQFDVVTSMEVIEHVMHPDQFVTNLFSLTKPGGLVFMSTISRTPLAYALTILGAERLLGLVPSGTHDYQKYIRPDELRAMVEPSGRVVDLRGIWYHPTAARWQVMDPTLLGRLGTQVNYIMVAQKPPVGLE